ncbi:hypothetical protein EG328_006026 [Venturia inaequalis]|uniref:Gylcosyl hydrolase 115 C-terminal domain-containing protein n=1 Tax=Venturia inaequalis TaxID=5025 RepID=A0A8H3VE64_VENIN|nr:hypothetical protein EG328_006026 [Venturia inaequalis]
MRTQHLATWLTGLATTVLAIGQPPTVTFEPISGALLLASRDQPVQIIVENGDWIAVTKAANDLAHDFGRIIGRNGTVLNTGATIGSGGVIIVGTLGRSPIIDRLAKTGKIQTNTTVGHWEAFTSSVVDSPIDGVSRALVIAGSDRRGSVYGLYDISEQIGVSPWYWWADVPARSRESIYALSVTKVQASPSVKYRGFFINDEAPALTGWANAKFKKSKTGVAFGTEFYGHVFELLLRLRANYLWPAMWGKSSFNIDDPGNQKLADDYGIVMGTSHTEPMMRSTHEQTVFVNGTWEWDINNASMKAFMLDGAKRAKPYESLYTIGIRGNHDTPISGGNAIKQLEGIIAAQREILDTIYGDAKKVPQVWALYKEVQGYYDNDGLQVPDDVTLLWADDNYGSMRRLPVASESARSGGAGVYYHFDYVGGPRNYKWINTIQLQKTWEHMTMAYKRDTKNIWLVNVGDIKPLELPISHFFDLAYDISLYSKPESTDWWLGQWTSREFGAEYAKNISAALVRYMSLAGKRKYELVVANTYSIINYDEGDSMLAEWQNLARDAQAIYDKLLETQKPAFFELVLHPILAGGNHYDVVISAAKNVYYASQGRSRANVVADHVKSKWAYDQELKNRYHELLEGKWNHMMDQTHFYNNSWQQPEKDQMPPIQYVQPRARTLTGDMGIAIEGSNASLPGDDRSRPNSGTLTMIPASPFGKAPWIDIFTRGTENFTFTITSSQSWVTVSPNTGTITPDGTTDIRAKVKLDWKKAPPGSGTVLLKIESSTNYGTQGSMPHLNLPYTNSVLPTSFKSGFVESDATISMEAEHYSQIIPGTETTQEYIVLPDYGKTLSGITLADVKAPSLTTTTGPRLEYNVYTFTNTNTTNQTTVTLILSPSLNTTPARPLKYAIAFDHQAPQIVQFVVDGKGSTVPKGWDRAAGDACWTSSTRWNITDGAHTLKFWALEPGVVLQKIVIDLGGVRKSYLGPPESYRV